MSGQLIGGVVGAVIGFYAGNPQLGWMIGSAIGGALDPTKIDGPRLQDRRVQASTYGATIPILYGSTAGAGNVIDSTDLAEHDVEEDGKGGPVTTTHTYSATFAVLLAEGVVPGIRRIWADAKLIYDISAEADSATQAASAEFAKSFVFYSGTETQLPDPTLEAIHGVGNVTAYRGSCYVVFTDLPLQAYGNRIPNLRFETGATPTAAGDLYAPLKLSPWTTDKPAHSNGGVTEYVVNGNSLATYRTLAEAEEELGRLGFTTYLGYGDLAGNTNVFGTVGDINAGEGLDVVRLYYGLTGKTYTVLMDGAGGTACAGLFGQVPTASNTKFYLLQSKGIMAPYQYLNSATGAGGDVACRDPTIPTTYRYVEPISYNDLPLQAVGGPIHSGMVSAQACVDGQLANAAASTDSLACGGGGTFTRTVSQASGLVGAAGGDQQWGIRIVYAGCFNANQVSTRTIIAELPPIIGVSEPSLNIPKIVTVRRIPSVPPSGAPTGDPCVLGVPTAIPGRAGFAIACDGTISDVSVVYASVAGTYKQLGVVTTDGANHVTQNAVGPIKLPTDPEYNDAAYWDAQATIAKAAGKLLPASVYPVVVTSAAKGTNPRLTSLPGEVTLSSLVADLCTRSGLLAANQNVTALASSSVQGFSIPRQMPTRAALLQLQQTFWWDFVESGRTLKAVMRGAGSVASITLDDLGANEGGESPVAVQPLRGQETELPATVNVSYPVRATGYEAGTQRARRTVTGSQQILSTELAVVMTDERAAQVADVLMYAAWTNRTQRLWSTTRKWAHLEPTDVLSVNDGEFNYQLRITDRSEEGSIVKWKGVDEAPAAYAPVVIASTPSGTLGGIRFDGPMKLELLDIPLLLDTNDDPGFYAAGYGVRPTWPGGVAFKSVDAGATYQNKKLMSLKATVGRASSVLGPFYGGNTVDEASALTVYLYTGTLSSITQDQLLNNGPTGNAALLGNEIIQFKRAVLVAADTYTLTGLLRGRKGTEQHMGTHVAGDRFVLLNASIYRIEDSIAQLGISALWKGVTSGQTLADALAQSFTNNAVGLKPLSPVNLHAVDIGGGQRYVSWMRRTRIGGKWRDVPVPLGETTELYQVAVNSGPAVSTSVNSLTVTAAPGDVITVWQISGSVGRGFPATVKI